MVRIFPKPSTKRETLVARRGWWALVPIVLCLAGCVWTEQAETSNFMDRLARQTVAPDSAILRIAMIEQPLGDEFLNGRLWEHVDELCIDEDCRALLKANGFRVGVLIGAPSSQLQKLLLSKYGCTARDSAFSQGKILPISLGPLLPRTSYCVARKKAATETALEDARYCLDVNARLIKEGTRLSFTPRVEHGAARLPFQTAADDRHWEMRTERASENYPELSWDLTLAPNQYLFIGARPECERTIGHSALTQGDGPQPVQRLLVLINCRAAAPPESGDEPTPGNAVPLALQAMHR